MKLRFTARAERHLNEIAVYIAERNPDAARAVGLRIREVVHSSPYLGREGTLAGTREMVVPSLYRVEADSVEILGVYHGARQKPE